MGKKGDIYMKLGQNVGGEEENKNGEKGFREMYIIGKERHMIWGFLPLNVGATYERAKEGLWCESFKICKKKESDLFF